MVPRVLTIKYHAERFEQRVERHIRPLPAEHHHGACATVVWDLWQREAWHGYYWARTYMWLVTACLVTVNLGSLGRLNWMTIGAALLIVTQIVITRGVLQRQRQRIEILQSSIAPKVRDYIP